MTLRSDDPDPYQAQFRYEVIHEFGHALGFAHEQERPDNWDPFDPNEDWLYCGATYQGRHGLSGGTYETPLFDYASIMDYCDSDPLGGFWRTTLSAGDITGVRNVYDRNPAAHGFMIQSDTNPGLAVSAAAGEGQPVQLRSDCTYRNPNCTWTYQYGMIVSDADPHYVIVPAGGVSDGNSLVLTQYCWTWEGQPGPPANQRGCTWTYRSGQFVNDLNTSLAMNAWGGARAGAGLVATSLCSPSNPDCTWTLPHVMFSSGQNSTLGMTASTIVNAGIMKIWDSCTPSSTNCTWKWTKGMLISDQNASLAVNAYGGAASGTVMRLSNACTATNQDCTWTWSHGELFSDNSRGGMVAAHPYGGAVYNAPLILDNGCDQTNPDCVFNSVFARDSW
jgi:hypothetical protein